MRQCAQLNIFRKGGFDPEEFDRNPAARVSRADLEKYLTGEAGTEIWELWLAASKTSWVIDQCIATTEPAYLAKHAFQLAQLFNAFYHRHPILSEADEGRKKFLLATVAVVRRELTRVLAVMGISVPVGNVAASRYRPTTNTTKLSGRMAGRGRGCSAVAAGAGPNFAVTRKI